MVPNKQILFQDIHGRILADGCQMYPEQYQNYDYDYADTGRSAIGGY